MLRAQHRLSLVVYFVLVGFPRCLPRTRWLLLELLLSLLLSKVLRLSQVVLPPYVLLLKVKEVGDLELAPPLLRMCPTRTPEFSPSCSTIKAVATEISAMPRGDAPSQSLPTGLCGGCALPSTS